MKKILFILTVIVAASLIIGSASAEGFFGLFEETSSDNDDNTFIVGFSAEFPPFTYKDEKGNYTGFDLDLAQEVAKRNNWTFKAQPIIDWNSKEAELNSNEVDCIWSEFTIDGRESNYTWSDPYFNDSLVILVKNDSAINSPEDLKGKNVEIQEGSSALQRINEQNESLKNTFAKVTQVREYDTGFMDLESGVCDAFITDVAVAKYHLKQKSADVNIKILDEQLANESYGVAFKKGNTGLKDQVQKTLDEMFKDGTVDKIAKKYDAYGIPEGLIHK